MSDQRLPRTAVCGMLLFLSAVSTAPPARAQPEPIAPRAVTSIAFEQSVLDNLGIEVRASGTADAHSPVHTGFAIPHPEKLVFAAPGGDFEGFAGGEAQHNGTLVLRVEERTLELSGFVLRVAADPLELDLFDATGRRRMRFESPQPFVRDGELHLQNVDVTIAPELAEELGRPALEGAYLGHAHVRLPVDTSNAAPDVHPSGGVGQCEGVFTADRDVALVELGTVSQLAREAGGRVSVTLSALLRNVGSSAILWNQPIEPDGSAANVGEHPYLVLNLYRIQDGRIKQIGRSDVKHAFFAANTACPCPGAQVIYPGCEDNYGANTNANRLYLAPRREVDASTGVWSPQGSHFDGAPADAFRDHGGDGVHDGFEHRLTVHEADLQSGGEYYIEGWYIVRDDIALLNSMGHYPISPALGAVWSFGPRRALTAGSILERFVDSSAMPPGDGSVFVNTGEGRLQLAVRSTDLGSGRFHYEYALMNFDFDRSVRAFSLALPAGVDVSNAEFVDADREAGNDWSVINDNAELTWSAAAGNDLEWGTLYSFAFDADLTPVALQATIHAASGAPAAVALQIPGPPVGAPPVSPPDGGTPSRGSALWAPLAALAALVLLLAWRRRTTSP